MSTAATERPDENSSNRAQSDDIQLSLTLGGISLKFTDDRWHADSTELEEASIEIKKIANERDNLIAHLTEAMLKIALLENEVVTIEATKNVALEIVRNIIAMTNAILFFIKCRHSTQLQEEREKNVRLQMELDEYKTELLESFKTIVELR